MHTQVHITSFLPSENQSSAYKWAAFLCSNKKTKKELDSTKFKKKIQSIVRRPSCEEEIVEELTACPVSNQMIPETSLECPTTKDAIPMCICSGKHIELDSTCFCPVSGLPALLHEYQHFVCIKGENKDQTAHSDCETSVNNGGHAFDPICGKQVSVRDLKLVRVHDLISFLNSLC